MKPRPINIELTIITDGKSTTIRREQATDSIGRVTETPAKTLRAVVADAQSWLRRNAGGTS